MLGISHIKRDKNSKSVIKKGKNIIWQKEGVGQVVVSLRQFSFLETCTNTNKYFYPITLYIGIVKLPSQRHTYAIVVKLTCWHQKKNSLHGSKSHIVFSIFFLPRINAIVRKVWSCKETINTIFHKFHKWVAQLRDDFKK